jgi:two-component system phosphate regulon sensor histidine kinase PhoR
MLVEGDHAQVMRQVTRSENGEIERISGGPILPLTTPTLHRMLNTGEPVLISDTRVDPEWHTLERSAWIRCYASAPLQIRQEVIGFLNINSEEPDYFDEESIQRLQAFASHAAAALHNARLYSDLQDYSYELEQRVEERTAQLSLAKNRIEAILESAPDAVFVLDSDDKLLESNQAGTFLRHQTENALTALFNPQLMDLLRSGEAPDEKAIVELNGRLYQALSSPIPFPDQQAGLVVVYRDVTRFQELDQMKTQFVSDVSHELRTPLANLTLFLDLLSDEQDNRKREKYQETLRRETNRLTELIEDLLTISRLESHKVSFFIKEVDIIELIHDLIVDRNRMAKIRDLALTFERPTEPLLGKADPRQLTQVLSNILTNAFNYTPAGGQIKVTAEKIRNRTETWITISISDNGFGIQAEEMERIFERFYRGSASRMTSAPGTGLGLAISQEILERMGGKITVKSKAGVGSSFTVWVQSVL